MTAHYTIRHDIAFGHQGHGVPTRTEGFSFPERRQHWTIGPRSQVTIDLDPPIGGAGLALDLHFVTSGRQHVQCRVNGAAIGDGDFDGICYAAWPLPALPPATRQLVIDFIHPDAKSPLSRGVGPDDRALALALQTLRIYDEPPSVDLTPDRRLQPLPALIGHDDSAFFDQVRGMSGGLSPDQLVTRFESLGHNCEFGMVQRYYRAEPLGLLRFSSIDFFNLIRGIATGFDGIDDPDQLVMFTDDNGPREWMVSQQSYRLLFHTFRLLGQADPDRLRHEVLRNLSFYRRLMIDNLQTPRKLFTFTTGDNFLPDNRLIDMLRRLRAWHPDHALLYVGLGDRGAVDRLGRGLYRGYIDQSRPGPDMLRGLPSPGWLGVCANAYRLWREDGGGAA